MIFKLDQLSVFNNIISNNNPIKTLIMKAKLIGLLLIVISTQLSFGQERGRLNPPDRTFTAAEQEIINISKEKWQWMADKNVDALNNLGVLYGKTGEYERAELLFREALTIRPGNTAAMDNLKHLKELTR